MGEEHASLHLYCAICQKGQRLITENFLGIVPTQSEWQFRILN